MASSAGRPSHRGTAAADQWRQLTGFYCPPVDGYLRSALALQTFDDHSVEVDDVSIEVLALPDVPSDKADFIFENELLSIGIGARGVLTTFICKANGKDYVADAPPFPIFTARRGTVDTPVHSLTREGDVLHAQFLDPDVRADLRITPRAKHFLIEVLSIEPEDVESLHIDLPVKRLESVAGAFNATYDADFGACMFGATVNVLSRGYDRGSEVRVLGGRMLPRPWHCGRKDGVSRSPL